MDHEKARAWGGSIVGGSIAGLAGYFQQQIGTWPYFVGLAIGLVILAWSWRLPARLIAASKALTADLGSLGPEFRVGGVRQRWTELAILLLLPLSIAALAVIVGNLPEKAAPVSPPEVISVVSRAPRIVGWGSVKGTTNSYVVVDGSDVLEEFRRRYFIVVIGRVVDTAIDAKGDTLIDVSNDFRVPPDRTTIALTHSRATLNRFRITGGNVHLWLVALPYGVAFNQIISVDDAVTKGGVICGEVEHNGFAIRP